jgi:hypothetical protein
LREDIGGRRDVIGYNRPMLFSPFFKTSYLSFELIIIAMSMSNVMTKKERDSGELEHMLTIKDLLVEIRVLNRLPQRPMIVERIGTKQALLDQLWSSGASKYNYDIHGNHQ